MVPMIRTSACYQERWTNSGANAKMTAAKRAGKLGMMVSLGRDAVSPTITSASSPRPAKPLAKLAKVELRTFEW